MTRVLLTASHSFISSPFGSLTAASMLHKSGITLAAASETSKWAHLPLPSVASVFCENCDSWLRLSEQTIKVADAMVSSCRQTGAWIAAERQEETKAARPHSTARRWANDIRCNGIENATYQSQRAMICRQSQISR